MWHAAITTSVAPLGHLHLLGIFGQASDQPGSDLSALRWKGRPPQSFNSGENAFMSSTSGWQWRSLLLSFLNSLKASKVLKWKIDFSESKKQSSVSKRVNRTPRKTSWAQERPWADAVTLSLHEITESLKVSAWLYQTCPTACWLEQRNTHVGLPNAKLRALWNWKWNKKWFLVGSDHQGAEMKWYVGTGLHRTEQWP